MTEDLDEALDETSVVETWRRDYSLNDFPRDESGEILLLQDTEKDFSIYVEWLADYLYNAPVPSSAMRQMIEQNLGTDKTPEHQILILAMDANNYDYEISPYDDDFNFPNTMDKDCLEPEIIKQAKLENEQKVFNGLNNVPCANFSDISWRVPLSWILKEVPDKQERVKLLRSYFEEYDELSYK